MIMKETLILHSCCGPCSTAVIERLLEDYRILVFYYNPNIHPEEEYLHRKEEQKRLIEVLKSKGNDVDFIEADYDPDNYFKMAEGLETEPEGGKRCLVCFKMRMLKAALFAKEHGYKIFDTTLSVSPHKNYDNIKLVGEEIEQETGIKYLGGNYKKQDGYKRSIELSKEYNLYRQNYCGCIFAKEAQDKLAK